MAPVKKKVKTKAQLDKLALGSGARVSDETGKQFNTSKQTAKPKPGLEKRPEKPKAEAPPAPPPQPALKGPDPGMVMIADKIEALTGASAQLMAELREQIAEINLSVDRPVLDWDFEFIRDDKGYLKRIKAHAEIVKPTLN